MSGEQAAIIGVGATRFGRFLDRPLETMACAAARAALREAELDAADADMVFFANAAAGLVTGREMIRGQAALRELGLRGVPVVNVENACASGSTALHLAVQAVRGGACERVLVVGAEKLCAPDRSVSMAALATAAADVPGLGAPTDGRSLFVDHYADLARTLIAQGRVTVGDLAWIAAKNHAHGADNPRAHRQVALRVADVLASPAVADPLTRAMCCPISDGAAAVVVTSARAAERRSATSGVRVLASVLVGGDPDGIATGANRRAADAAYEEAGVGPADLDVVELHDAAAPAELVAYEDLGLAMPGEAASLARSATTALGARLPVNVSGGLLACGHPIGATGLSQVVELVQQLRGAAGRRQVEGARLALAQNNGGLVGRDFAAAAVHVLGAA